LLTPQAEQKNEKMDGFTSKVMPLVYAIMRPKMSNFIIIKEKSLQKVLSWCILLLKPIKFHHTLSPFIQELLP